MTKTKLSDEEIYSAIDGTAKLRLDGVAEGGTVHQASASTNDVAAITEEAYLCKKVAEKLDALGNEERAKAYREREKGLLDRVREIHDSAGGVFPLQTEARAAVVDDDVVAVRDKDGEVVPSRVKMADSAIEGQDPEKGDEAFLVQPVDGTNDAQRASVVADGALEVDAQGNAAQAQAAAVDPSTPPAVPHVPGSTKSTKSKTKAKATGDQIDFEASTVAEVIEWAGDDPHRIEVALKHEKTYSDVDTRKTLIAKLESKQRKLEKE